MLEAHRKTPGHEPMGIAATDASGAILGLLTAVKIVTPGPWPERYATRSVAFAEPIVATDLNVREQERVLRALLKEHDRRWSERVLFTEIRPVHSGLALPAFEKQGYEYGDYDNYELDLRLGDEAIFQGMCHQRRNNIRANQRRGLTVKEVRWQSYLDTFYEHVCHSYSRSQMPVANIEHFRSVFEQLTPDQLRVTSAELDGVPIASAAHLLFEGRIYWWAAGTFRVKGIAPQASLVWEEIQWGIANGLRVYDFAGAGWAHERYAPGIFKSRFGGKKVNSGRYRKVYSKLRMKVAETGFQLFRPIFSNAKTSLLSGNKIAESSQTTDCDPSVLKPGVTKSGSASLVAPCDAAKRNTRQCDAASELATKEVAAKELAAKGIATGKLASRALAANEVETGQLKTIAASPADTRDVAQSAGGSPKSNAAPTTPSANATNQATTIATKS